MGICKDPRLTYLNELGYNVVRLPRKGIVPLGIIGSDNDSKSWLGTLDQIWHSEVPPPAPGTPQTVSGLTGQKTSDLQLSFGLEILANVLSGMLGTSAPSLDVSYKGATSLSFTFKDVQTVGVDPFVIGNFLAQGDIKPNPFVKRFFTGQKHVAALVVTEVLQAKSIGVTAKRDRNTELSVKVPEIKGIVGANVSVTAGNATETEVIYAGPEYLAFGYKAFGIGMINGQWNVYGVDADSGNAFALNQDARGFVDADVLADINFNPSQG